MMNEVMNEFIKLLRGSGSIILSKNLAKNIGLHEAIIYGELVSMYIYYYEKGRLDREDFYCTVEKLENNTTLSKRQQSLAIKKLISLGLITKRNGKDNMRYFKIIPNKDLLRKHLTSPTNTNFKYYVPTRNKIETPLEVSNCSSQDCQDQTLSYDSVEAESDTSSFQIDNTKYYTKESNTTTTVLDNNNLEPIYSNQEEIITSCKDDVVVEPVIVDTSKDLKPIIKTVVDEPIIKATTEDRSYLNLFRANFKVKYKAVLDEFKLKEVFIDKGKKVLDYYMEHLQEFMDSSTRKIESIAAYFIAAVQREYVLPVGYSGNGQRKSTGTPPIQSTNYTQREYSDEFFDSLYSNAHLL